MRCHAATLMYGSQLISASDLPSRIAMTTSRWRWLRLVRLRCSAHLTTNRLLVSEEIGNLGFETKLSLADITFVSKAIRTTVLANAFDMNVSTAGSLLLRLSHDRNGLSTHPPSKLGMFPSKFPTEPPNRSTCCCVLQQSCPVSMPLAGIPAMLKLIASVPTGEKSSWLSPIELK